MSVAVVNAMVPARCCQCKEYTKESRPVMVGPGTRQAALGACAGRCDDGTASIEDALETPFTQVSGMDAQRALGWRKARLAAKGRGEDHHQ